MSEDKIITMEDLMKQVAELSDAVKNIKEPNKDELLAGVREIMDAQVKTLTAPIKSKEVALSEEIKADKGKYKGMSLNDMELHRRLMKSFKLPETASFTKAMDSTTADYGDEWVPTLMDSALWENWVTQSKIASLIKFIDMPSNPYTLPIKDSGMTIYYNSTENTATTGTSPATGSITLTAAKLMGEVDFSYEIDEDAVLNLRDVIVSDINDKMTQAIDNVILNGDTTTGAVNINYYATGGSNIGAGDKVLVFDGLRHFCLVDNTSQKSAITAAPSQDGFLTVMKLLGKYATRAGECACIVDPWTYLAMLDISEIITLEKYGAGATIFNGEVGKLHGISVIPSEEFGKTDTSGYINQTAGSNAKGSFVIFHRPSVVAGRKRQVLLESDKDITTQTNKLVISTRMAFEPWGVASSQSFAGLGYNVTI